MTTNTTRYDDPAPSNGDGIDWILRLRPQTGVNAEQALRAGLKRLLRSHGLRCISAKPVAQDAADGDSGDQGGDQPTEQAQAEQRGDDQREEPSGEGEDERTAEDFEHGGSSRRRGIGHG